MPVATPRKPARWTARRGAGSVRPVGHRDQRQDAAGAEQARQPPQAPGRVLLSARRRRRGQEDADPAGHADGGQQVPHLDAAAVADGGEHRQVTEDEQQLRRQDRLDQRQRPEAQRGDLQGETREHAGKAEQPDWLPGQPEYQPGVETADCDAAGAQPLAYRRGSGAETSGDRQQDRKLHALKLRFSACGADRPYSSS
jgi:hypothetical protein